MESNQPEPSSSSGSPQQSSNDVGISTENQAFCDVNYVNDASNVDEFHNENFVSQFKAERLSPVVSYGQFNVDRSDSADSTGTFVQVSIQPYSASVQASTSHQQYEDPEDAEASREHLVNDLSVDSKGQMVDTLSISQNSIVHGNSSEVLTAADESQQVLSLHEESTDSHPPQVQEAETVLGRVSLDQLNLQHISVLHHGIPNLAGILFDRNSIAAIMAAPRADASLCLDATGIPRSVISSQNLPQRTLLNAEQTHFLSTDPSLATISHNLLSPILTQKDILPSIIASSSSSTLNPATISNSYPLTHKQMLVQKYAAELETPATSASLIAEIRDQQLIESISDRVSSPYVVASSNNALIDSHGISVYGDHVSLPSTSAGQCLPLEVYSIDRGVALVSSTRDSPEDIMHGDVEFSSVSHSSTHPTVQNYVSSSVDLVHPHHIDHGMHCAVDSTVGPKLHPSEENMVDSSDTYGDHDVDASDNILHTTSREDYSCHIADMNSCDDVAANNVTSVLNNAAVLDANEALSSTTSRVFSAHTQCMYLSQHHNFDRTVQISGSVVHDGTDDIQGCSTVSSATYPDSTHSPIGMAEESPDHMVCDIPSDSPEDMVQSENSRPRRDLRTNRHWCDDCSMFYEKDCPHHRIQLIVDKPVLSRAFASLPATYLYVNKIGIDEGGEPVYGVFAKKTIPKRTQFGPVEGVLVKREDPPSECFILIVEHDDGLPLYLDTSDESMSNWMRFVRPAGVYKEQNLVLVQQGTSLFFNTTRSINPKTELRVWYSPTYATKWGLPVLEPDEEEKRMLQEQENAWPCFECNQRFATSDDLQKHLNQHDEENGALSDLVTMRARHKARMRAKIVKKNPRIKPAYQVALGSVEEVSTQTLPPSKRARGRPPKRHKIPSKQEDYKCEICLKVFPRNYSLQRHLIMHSGEKKYKCPICDMKFSHVYNRNRHVRRHKQREEGEAANNIPKPKSIFKKKQGTEWICTHCDLTFDNSNVCNLHTLTHAAEDVGLNESDHLFDKKYGSEDGLDAGSSESSKLGDELHKCPECTQEFLSKRDLIEHASVHGKVGKSRCYRGGIINPLKPFKCNLCYKSFASDERLIRHYLVHGSEDSKPLQCDICFKRFLNNSALACHVKVHSEEKKFYECPICKEEFDQIVALKDHVHIHCCNGVYNCPNCHKTFEEYNQIRKHIRAFHSERRYPCDKCEKIFPRPDKLKLHMLRHSDHREFLCANCGKQFKRKDKLKEHMKRMHAPEREAKMNAKNAKSAGSKKFIPKVSPTDYHRFIYKCHSCLLGFKRRGMLVNHLAKRHPDIRPESVPELNLPILKTTRDYYCQYCEKVYKSSSKRKAHILKNHPGADLPMSNRRKGGVPEIPGVPNPTFSQTVGSITTHPHHCNWCHKQYASKAKLLQHQRKKHMDMLALSYVDVANAKVEAVCDQGTQVTGQILIESVANGISPETAAVLIDATKRKIQYLDREALVAATTHPDGLPTADLLTQAMSELTQNLEYRAAPGEFLTARLTESVPTTAANSSPSITPSPTPTPATVSTPTSPNISETTTSTSPLDQIQLNQLLAQYQQQALSPQQLAVVVTSRTWPAAVTATLSNYPAR